LSYNLIPLRAAAVLINGKERPLLFLSIHAKHSTKSLLSMQLRGSEKCVSTSYTFSCVSYKFVEAYNIFLKEQLNREGLSLTAG